MWRFPEIGVLHGIPLYHLFQWDFLIFPNKNHPFGGTPIYGSPQIINHRWNSFIWTMAVLACISCRPRCAASAKERWAASLCCCTWASNFQLVASQKLYGYNKNQSYSIKPSRNTGKNWRAIPLKLFVKPFSRLGCPTVWIKWLVSSRWEWTCSSRRRWQIHVHAFFA